MISRAGLYKKYYFLYLTFLFFLNLIPYYGPVNIPWLFVALCVLPLFWGIAYSFKTTLFWGVFVAAVSFQHNFSFLCISFSGVAAVSFLVRKLNKRPVLYAASGVLASLVYVLSLAIAGDYALLRVAITAVLTTSVYFLHVVILATVLPESVQGVFDTGELA